MNIETLDSKQYNLENGLKVISIKKDTKMASVQLGIKVGPLDENIDEKGISHFIEHMMFKGTEKRSNEVLNKELEARGGSYNAYTTYTSTVYGLSGLEEELEPSIEILSDMVMNSSFPEQEFKKEKTVVLAEIRNTIDDVECLSFNKINKSAFEKSHLRYDIAGNTKLINSFTRNQLFDYYKKYYIPNNSVISIISSYDHSEVEQLIKKYLSNWEQQTLIKQKAVDEDNISVEKIDYKKDLEQNTIIFLYTFHGLSEKEELALDILNYKLGESSNSILFRELREKKGMAYDVYSDTDRTKHIKTLYIYTSVGDSDIEEAKSTIEQIISDILDENIDLDEQSITHMKKVMKTGIISMIEDGESLCNYALHQTMADKKIDEFLYDLEALQYIDIKEIYDVAKKIFIDPTIHILKGK